MLRGLFSLLRLELQNFLGLNDFLGIRVEVIVADIGLQECIVAFILYREPIFDLLDLL